MCVTYNNEVDYFKQHLSEILKNVQDDSDSPISLSPTLLEQMLPTFFASSNVGPADIVTNKADLLVLRNDGFLIFYQSLTSFTVKKYNTLNPGLLERILFQANSLMPLTKIAASLQLDNWRYSAQNDSCDRLTIILGMLSLYFGTQAVDSLLHPLFITHIFGEKHAQQSDQSKNITAFRNSILQRGGSFEVDYQPTQSPSSQTPSRWECTIKYQLARNAPSVMHQRNGRSKKQARLRALQDIHNYYTRNDVSLVLDCSSSSSSSSISSSTTKDHFDYSSHPHSQLLAANDTPGHTPRRLSIPPELLYQHDDADHPQPSSPTSTVLSVKRNHDNMVADPSHVDCNNNDSDDNENQRTSFLSQALLYSFSNLSCNDTQQPSPVSAGSPASIVTLKQPTPLSDSSTLTTPTTISSPSSTNTLSIRTEHLNDEWMDQPMTNKKQRTYPLETSLVQQQQQQQQQQPQTYDMILDQHDKAPSPPPEALVATASQMVALLSDKSRLRVQALADQVGQQPGNVKAVLMNLAAKLERGSYACGMKHTNPSPTNTAYYSATVTFTAANLALEVTRQHSKKTDAEIKAALAIFSLLVASSTNTPTTALSGQSIEPTEQSAPLTVSHY